MDNSDELVAKRVVLHRFPSKICSVQFGPSITVVGRMHSGPWTCIRTISSTVFASVEVSSKQELLLGHPEFRLVALLEILHGGSVLSSNVVSRRIGATAQFLKRYKVVRSEYPIVDVQFHPDRSTLATTVDSRGNVGSFAVDLFMTKDESWEKSVSWEVKQTVQREERDSRWIVNWADDDDTVVLADQDAIIALSLTHSTQQAIHTSPTDNTIVAMVRSASPHPLLWVVTIKEVLLFDLRADTRHKPLLAWQHNRSHGSLLRLSLAPAPANSTAIVLSNCCDRMLSLYTANLDPITGFASAYEQPLPIATSLTKEKSYACGPRFVAIASLHALWHKWLARASKHRKSPSEGEHLMIEMASDGSIWLQAVMYAPVEYPLGLRISQPGRTIGLQRRAQAGAEQSEIIAERSLHSLGAVYRVLMANRASESDQTALKPAITTLLQASRWLQEQDVQLDTMLLP